MGLTYAVMQVGRAWLGLQPLLVARILTVGLALAGTALRSYGHDNLYGCGIFLQLFSLGSGGLWMLLWVDEKVASDEADWATGVRRR